MHQLSVSFDDWDNPSSLDTNLLTPTPGSSIPTSTLETVLEQSAPSSPQPVIMVTETSFPYTPKKTSPSVARSLEAEFNDEKPAQLVQDEKEPLIEIYDDENKPSNHPLGHIPVSNKLVEIPINFETSSEKNTGPSEPMLSQPNGKCEKELNAQLNLLQFEDGPNLVHHPVDGSTIGNNRRAVGGWSSHPLDDENSLSNSVDSGLHESTDQLLDTRELSGDVLDNDGSAEQRGTRKESECEFRIGQVISVGDSKKGTIRYIGTTEFSSGEWVGVELDLPIGKRTYFLNIHLFSLV